MRREDLPQVWEGLGELPQVREGLGGSLAGLGWIERISRRSGRGREDLPQVWVESRGPPAGPGGRKDFP